MFCRCILMVTVMLCRCILIITVMLCRCILTITVMLCRCILIITAMLCRCILTITVMLCRCILIITVMLCRCILIITVMLCRCILIIIYIYILPPCSASCMCVKTSPANDSLRVSSSESCMGCSDISASLPHDSSDMPSHLCAIAELVRRSQTCSSSSVGSLNGSGSCMQVVAPPDLLMPCQRSS